VATVSQVARISLKNILFPTDFSPASEAALPFAWVLARLYGATLQVAHVILPASHPQVLGPHLPAELDSVWDAARNRLDWFTHHCGHGDVPCRALLGNGDLADVIPQLIREHEVDMVVVGTQGRRGFSKMMMGSGAERIYRSAQCPVLTVGPQAAAGEWKLRRILCPVEVEQDPEPALRYGLSLAEENQAEFIVMQAVPMIPWQHRARVEAQAFRRLTGLIPESAKDWSTPEIMVRWEHPAEATLQAAAERQVDLVVMGVRRARAAGLSAHLPWPVASEVVSLAPCPVLTVRV